MQTLASQRLVYRCDLTRREIEQAVTAPHIDDHEIRFPAELRPGVESTELWSFTDESANYRLRVPERRFTIEDDFAGHVELDPFNEVGDFVVWTRRGVPAYQLAVVVDDARQGVTHVIRGDDLLPSAARQTLIYEALGAPPPKWMHLPLVLGPDGRRLAKRHGDTRVETYRAQGVPAERIIGLIAHWSGVSDARVELSAADFLGRFELDTLPKCPITFTQDDHAWLLSHS
jgi:glutamyl-tRNA synthetase